MAVSSPGILPARQDDSERAVDVNTLISGFIGSFLGVASGFLGAIFLDWRHRRHERRTHILALMREMLSNNVRVQLLL